MKTMKKSMFITTIMMVVLLVVALSTATFAWYTAQSSVSATETTLTSATTTSASLAIDKANAGAAATGSSVTLTMSNGAGVGPAVPSAAPEAGTTTYAAFTASLKTAPMDNAGKFSADPAAATVATINKISIDGNAAEEATGFYIINTNGTNATNVNVKVNIDIEGYSVLAHQPNDWNTKYNTYFTRTATGVAAKPYNYEAVHGVEVGGNTVAPDFKQDTYYVQNSKIARDLRVAVFADDKYVATWTYTDTAKYGTIVNGESASFTTTFDASASGADVSLGEFTALQGKFIQIVAWYDGVGLVVDDAGLPAVFSLQFNAVK